MDMILQSMFDCLKQGNNVYLPSKFWDALNRKNIDQLAGEGIRNIKRTVAQNYFTWVIGRNHEQFRFLLKNTPLRAWPSMCGALMRPDKTLDLTRTKKMELILFTAMLWNYAKDRDREGLLAAMDEPLAGNPFKIYVNNKLVSQDLANSLLEYYSIREQFSPSAGTTSVCELGAGYGRNAFVFLKAIPSCKYVIVDIPPALHVSQHYLSEVFPEKKIFSFRCFKTYAEIEKEFESSDICFLLPHQAEVLPRKYFDLFINISSLHEMKMDQIQTYFKLIDRLTRGCFYSKQWLVSNNPDDGTKITEGDYPVPPTWRELYHRTAKVQVSFFEAMYALGSE